MHATFPARPIRALSALAADKNDIRYYPRGVWLETEPGRIRIMATDGSVLGVWTEAREGVTDTASYFLMSDDVKHLPAAKTATVSMVDGTLLGGKAPIRLPLGYKCPDYRRLFRTYDPATRYTVDQDMVHWQPAVLAKLATCAARLGVDPTKVVIRDGSPALWTMLGTPIVGLVQPMRTHDGQKTLDALAESGLTEQTAKPEIEPDSAPVLWRGKPIPELNMAYLEATVRESMFGTEDVAFCVDCGAEHGSCEPDMERGYCENCGERRVYGAERIMLECVP